MKTRKELIEKLELLEDLLIQAENELSEIEKDLSSTSSSAFHFPSIRNKKVERRAFLIEAKPRIKAYFNNILNQIRYE